MADSCATCFFGRTAPTDDPFTGSLLCGRNAPTFQQGAGPLWPVVNPDFWCGEFSNIDPHVYGIIGPPGPAGPAGPTGPQFSPLFAGGFVANTTGISSPGGAMLGLARYNAANIITPLTTGRLIVLVSGKATNGSAINCSWGIRVGTGAAPLNADPPIGTAYGSTEFCNLAGITGVNLFALVTGLSLNVPAWIDLLVSAGGSGNNVTVDTVNIMAMEI